MAAETSPTVAAAFDDTKLEQLRSLFASEASLDAHYDLLDDLPGELDLRSVGIDLLRDLLEIEEDPARFARILRVWSGRIIRAIRDGDFRRANDWMRAVTDAPTYSASFAYLVADAFSELSNRNVMHDLIVNLAESKDLSVAAPLLSAWGEPFVDYLIEMMIDDEAPVSRRHMIELLAASARDDTRLLAAHLADPRWFVVRNVAIALGRTGRPQAGRLLESLLRHEDERVRVEALRGSMNTLGDDGVPVVLGALRDPSPRVRHAAVTLLRASGNPRVLPSVIAVVDEADLAAEELERLVGLVAERPNDIVEPTLERWASRRLSFGNSKTVRQAAKEKLERRRLRQ